MTLSKNSGLLLITLLGILFLAIVYPEVFFGLNAYFFRGDGDGLQNYFNVAYHIKHDPTYSSFDGFNYPYNEYLMFVDCQPLLANILKFISNNVVDISNYTVGILNGIMLSSFVLCAIYVYLIFIELRLSIGLAIVSALGITTLSSNVLLWQFGHYALSYAFFFPMCWFYLMRYFQSPNKMTYSLIIGAIITAFFFTHVYLGFILFLFVFISSLYYALSNKEGRRLALAFHFFVQLIVPFGIFFFVLKFFDVHPDRVDLPFVTDYLASPYTVFYPYHSFTKPIYDAAFNYTNSNPLWWGRVGSYIGISTIVILLFALVSFMKSVVSKEVRGPMFNIGSGESKYVVSGFVLLLFSMGIPFAYGLEFLMPDALKQIVALGRFSWPSYFVVTVMSLVYLYRKLPGKSGVILVAISSLLLFGEGLSNHLVLREKIGESANIFNPKEINKTDYSEIDFSAFQAILPLPFYQVGGAPNLYYGSDKSKSISTQLSYYSGLPLMSSMLSRASKSESRKVLELLQPIDYQKEAIKLLGDKPLLLAITKEELNEQEKDLMDRAKLIGVFPDFSLFQLEKNDLQSDDYAADVQFQIAQMERFSANYTGSIPSDSLQFVQESFNDEESEQTFRGSGAKQFKKLENNKFYTSEPNTLEAGVELEISFWYYNRLVDQTFNTVSIIVKNKHGEVTYSKYFDPTRSNIYARDWAFVQQRVTLQNSSDIIHINSKGSVEYSPDVFFDELLIRPIDENIYKGYRNQSGEYLIKNNEEFLIRD